MIAEFRMLAAAVFIAVVSMATASDAAYKPYGAASLLNTDESVILVGKGRGGGGGGFRGGGGGGHAGGHR